MPRFLAVCRHQLCIYQNCLGLPYSILVAVLFPLDARIGCEGGQGGRPDESASDALAAWRAPTLPRAAGAAGAGGGALLVDDVGATTAVRGRLLASVLLPSLLLCGRFSAAPAEGPD